MNETWPEQEVFCLRVREFAEREGYLTPRKGIDLERLAPVFDLAVNSLKQFLQNKRRPRPHYDTLAKIAETVGVSVTEFMGAGGPPAESGTDPGFANVMGVLGKDLSPEWKARLIELAKAAQVKAEEKIVSTGRAAPPKRK